MYGNSCLRFHLLLEVNSGLVMGYAYKFRKVLEQICTDYKCNKHGSCDYLLELYKDNFIVDDDNDLFYNYYLVGPYKFIIVNQKCKHQISIENKRVKITKNNRIRFPCAIHFPKKSYNKEIINQLGYNIDNMVYDAGTKYLVKDFFKHYSMYLNKYYVLIILIILCIYVKKSK